MSSYPSQVTGNVEVNRFDDSFTTIQPTLDPLRAPKQGVPAAVEAVSFSLDRAKTLGSASSGSNVKGSSNSPTRSLWQKIWRRRPIRQRKDASTLVTISITIRPWA
jgi:hypothetical protein